MSPHFRLYCHTHLPLIVTDDSGELKAQHHDDIRDKELLDSVLSELNCHHSQGCIIQSELCVCVCVDIQCIFFNIMLIVCREW